MRALSRREHSRAELLAKFKGRADDATLLRLLDEFAEAGYQSDQRYAESFVRSRINRGQGPVRIAAELQQRGCSRSLIETYLHHVDHDWPALAREALQKRFGFEEDRPELGPRAFGKAGRFLAARGFPAGLVHQLVRQSFTEAPEDDPLEEPVQ